MTKEDVGTLSKTYTKRIIKMIGTEEAVVMVQGEFTLCFGVISLLKEKGIKCVAAISERKTEEIRNGSECKKISFFKFCNFREY